MTHGLSDKDVIALKKIKEFEDITPEEEWPLGWQWHQVGVHQGTINKLITLGMVKRTYSSRSSKEHKLTDRAKEIMDAEPGDDLTPPVPIHDPTGDDYASMFSDIVGYSDLKELIRESLQLDKPIHVLLVGPPATAKSLILYNIERVLAGMTMWAVGSGASRAGLWDTIADNKPKVLLFDEIDKLSSTDSSALLSLMETGRLVRTKVHRSMDIKVDIQVIGSANRIFKMSPELLSRFKVYPVHEYNATEFREVVTKALVAYEQINQGSASEIAVRLVGKTHDIREAIRVARLSRRVGIKRAVELLII